MAQLVKRNSIWYTRFQYKGKDYWRSTGQESKTKAKTRAAEIEAEVKGEVSLSSQFEKVLTLLDAMDTKDADKQRRDFAGRLLRDTRSKLAVADAWSNWLSNPRRGKRADPKATTIAGYWAVWVRFAGDLEKAEKRPGWLKTNHPEVKYLHEVTDAIAEEYAEDILVSGVTANTFNAHVKFLRSLFETLSVKAGILVNPWRLVTTLESETISKRELTAKEMAKVCREATGDLRYWLAIGIYTGLRLGDVVTLRWDEVDLKAELIRRIPLKMNRKGTSKQVQCPIHPVLGVVLAELRADAVQDAEYLFPAAVLDYRKDRAGVSKRIQTFLSDTCKIQTTEEVAVNGRRKRAVVKVGFHSLRHSFVSLCAANRVPQPAIMALVGQPATRAPQRR